MKENNIATNKVQWTDLQFGTLNKVRGTDNMKDTKYIIREAIDNDGTINVIKTAHQRYPKNFNANGKGTFDLSEPNDVDAAVTIEGTRNGNAAPFWPKDYTKGFGTQAIKKVHVWDQVPGGPKFDGEKTSGIAFELGPAWDANKAGLKDCFLSSAISCTFLLARWCGLWCFGGGGKRGGGVINCIFSALVHENVKTSSGRLLVK